MVAACDGALVALAANDGWNIVNYRAGLIRALQAAGYRIAVLAPPGPHDQAIRDLGISFFPIPLAPRGRSPVADLRTFAAYLRTLRRLRPAALLGFTAKPNIYGSLAAHWLGIPVVNNISGLGAVFASDGPLNRLVTGLYRLSLGRSAKVFFQNPDDRALFEARGVVRRGQAGLLPGSGVDLERFAPRPRPAGDPFTFLFAARLLWDKGLGEFVEAARRLRAQGTGARFQVLGMIEPASGAAVPRAALAQWESEGILEYLGSTDDVRGPFAAADCLVLPSYYREGTPRVLLEAAAMGIPSITTDTPGCREAVDDGVTGMLCEPRSIDALVSSMERIIAMSAAQRSQLGKAARAKMEREFREELVHRAYLEALSQHALRGD
ncbi:MAG TPA: glycosyltransferase family 4 protein [Sphingomicrobium sp.]|nr:glycosyltransferase family 4 protein [Sphingomicrobium sp.]